MIAFSVYHENSISAADTSQVACKRVVLYYLDCFPAALLALCSALPLFRKTGNVIRNSAQVRERSVIFCVKSGMLGRGTLATCW